MTSNPASAADTPDTADTPSSAATSAAISVARAQHRAVLAPVPTDAVAESLGGRTRPRPGSIAVLPSEVEIFAAAVTGAGGELAPLSEHTRGLIWLSSDDPRQLVDTLEAHPSIEWVQLPWAGVDAYADAIHSFAGRPLPLWTSAKGAYSQPVAEHALTLALALLRVIPTRVRAGSWSGTPEGRSLYGLHVVIVGAGGIAVELLNLLRPFDVETTVVRRRAEPLAGATRTIPVGDLTTVLPDADVVVIAAALTIGTAGLIGRDELAAMKPDAVLVNIARGGLIDTGALADALAAGRLAGAGLDVTDPEPLPDGHRLWSEPRALITPHSADTPDMTAPLLAERIRANVRALLGDGPFVGIVDPTEGY